jgi:hypothetical protein
LAARRLFPPTSKYYTSGKDRDKWIKEIDRIVTPKDVFNEVKKDLRPVVDFRYDLIDVLNEFEDDGYDYSIDEYIIVDLEYIPYVLMYFDIIEDEALIPTDSIKLIGVGEIIKTFSKIEEKKIVFNVSISNWGVKVSDKFTDTMKSRFPFVSVEFTDKKHDKYINMTISFKIKDLI